MSHTKARVGILFPSDEVLKIIDDTIRTKQRSQLTYSLINSYGLMNFMKEVPFKIGKIFNIIVLVTFFSRRRKIKIGSFVGLHSCSEIV